VAALVATFVVGALAACSQVLGINADRHLAVDSAPDAGVEAEAAAPAGPWDCLSDPPETFPANLNTTVTLLTVDSLQPILTAQAVDGGSGLVEIQYTPLTNIPVRACPTVYDPTCAKGVPAPPGWNNSGDAGMATFTLPNSFGGYFQFADDAGLFTTSFYASQLMAGDTTDTIAATMLPLSATIGLEAVLQGVHLDHDTDGGLGHILLTVFDCHDHSAPGVYFTPSQVASPGGMYQTQIFYTVGTGGSSSEIPSTTAMSTDNSGTGGILNVPAGEINVKAFRYSDNAPIGVINLLVPPGTAASAILRVRTH